MGTGVNAETLSGRRRRRERVERGNMAFARSPWMRVVSVGVLALSLVGVTACGSTGGSRTFQTQEEGGFRPFGLGRPRAPRDNGGSGGAQLGVIGYLWRATLDSLSFPPLASADPHGGVVIPG